MHLLLVWVVWAVTIWLTARFLPGFEVPDLRSAFIVAVVFGLINAVVGHFLYLAIGITTLGLGFVFGFVTRWFVTAVVLEITDGITDKLTIRNFGTALVASGVISIIGSIGEQLVLHGTPY